MRQRVLLRDLVFPRSYLVALSACDDFFNQFCRPKLFLISGISRTLDVFHLIRPRC